MLELLALIGLAIAALVVFAVLGVILGLLKIAFKLVLLPLTLAWGLFKFVLVCGLVLLAVVAALALAPLALAILVVVVPVLALAGLVGIGWAVVAA